MKGSKNGNFYLVSLVPVARKDEVNILIKLLRVSTNNAKTHYKL